MTIRKYDGGGGTTSSLFLARFEQLDPISDPFGSRLRAICFLDLPDEVVPIERRERLKEGACVRLDFEQRTGPVIGDCADDVVTFLDIPDRVRIEREYTLGVYAHGDDFRLESLLKHDEDLPANREWVSEGIAKSHLGLQENDTP